MQRRFRFLSFTALLLLVHSASASSNSTTCGTCRCNSGFEKPQILEGRTKSSGDVDGWKASSDPAPELWKRGVEGLVPPQGEQVLYMPVDTEISKAVNATGGSAICFSFDGKPRNSLGRVSILTVVGDNEHKWKTHTFDEKVWRSVDGVKKLEGSTPNFSVIFRGTSTSEDDGVLLDNLRVGVVRIGIEQTFFSAAMKVGDTVVVNTTVIHSGPAVQNVVLSDDFTGGIECVPGSLSITKGSDVGIFGATCGPSGVKLASVALKCGECYEVQYTIRATKNGVASTKPSVNYSIGGLNFDRVEGPTHSMTVSGEVVSKPTSEPSTTSEPKKTTTTSTTTTTTTTTSESKKTEATTMTFQAETEKEGGLEGMCCFAAKSGFEKPVVPEGRLTEGGMVGWTPSDPPPAFWPNGYLNVRVPEGKQAIYLRRTDTISKTFNVTGASALTWSFDYINYKGSVHENLPFLGAHIIVQGKTYPVGEVKPQDGDEWSTKEGMFSLPLGATEAQFMLNSAAGSNFYGTVVDNLRIGIVRFEFDVQSTPIDDATVSVALSIMYKGPCLESVRVFDEFKGHLTCKDAKTVTGGAATTCSTQGVEYDTVALKCGENLAVEYKVSADVPGTYFHAPSIMATFNNVTFIVPGPQMSEVFKAGTLPTEGPEKDETWATIGTAEKDETWATIGTAEKDETWATIGTAEKDETWASINTAKTDATTVDSEMWATLGPATTKEVVVSKGTLATHNVDGQEAFTCPPPVCKCYCNCSKPPQ